MEIVRAEQLPFEGIEPLVLESQAAGFRHLARLRDDWLSGANRFDRPGEALLVGWEDETVVAVGGVNVDPYAGDDRIGRIRRVYVREARRGEGIGRTLVEALKMHACRRFQELRLRAGSPEAALFFEALGFERAGEEGSELTHRIRLLP